MYKLYILKKGKILKMISKAMRAREVRKMENIREVGMVNVICIRALIRDGTKENPAREVYTFYLPSGKKIGEMEIKILPERKNEIEILRKENAELKREIEERREKKLQTLAEVRLSKFNHCPFVKQSVPFKSNIIHAEKE